MGTEIGRRRDDTYMDGFAYEWVDGRLDYRYVDKRLYEAIGCMADWVDGWMNDYMDERVTEWAASRH